MKTYTEKACGKVNLSLNITGRKDGMHLLDSVTAAVDVFDTLTVRFDESGDVRVRFFPRADAAAFAPFAEKDVGEENTVTSAVRLLQSRFPRLGADVTVQKGIPLAGGMGGSSADAAAFLRAASYVYGSDPKWAEIENGMVQVGSDVPVLYRGGGVRMRGVGEALQSVPMPALYLTVAHKGVGVTSREAYARFDALCPDCVCCPSDNDALLAALQSGDVQKIAPHLGNALQSAAVSLCPQIRDTVAALQRLRPAATFLTGSGACCCALFASLPQARAAAQAMRSEGFLAIATQTVAQ